jgi:phage terminase large subunit-like protein
LELWQKALISCIFGLVDENGVRVYREIFICMGRKCGKSLLASGVSEYMAYADGEYGADVFFLAPKLEQADIVFNDFWKSVSNEPDLMKITKKRKMDIYVESTNTSIKKVPFSERKSDGFNPHLTVCDEVAAWIGDQGIKQYSVMTSALGAREQPLILSITTANYVNDGIYDELFKRATAFLMGNSREKRLLPFLYQIDDVTKWADLTELQKSIPNLGVSVSVDYILEEISKAEESLANKAEFMTKFACIKQNSSMAWLSSQDIGKCFQEQRPLESFRHTYALGGIDLSLAVDLTAAVICIEQDGITWFETQFFMPANKVEEATARDGLPYRIYQQRGLLTVCGENTVDYHEVQNWFNRLEKEYEILPLKVGYDRYSAAYLVQDMEADGYQMESVSQGSNLTGVLIDMEGMIKDGRLRCMSDNDLMKVHMLDAALKFEEGTNRRRLIKMNAKAHIDGMAALSDAICMRHNYYEEYAGQLSNKR